MSVLTAEQTSYKVVTGISAGSTLTAAYSVFPVGQEKAAVDLMYQIISQLDQASIFTQWPGGILEGFFEHSSLFDSTPLRNLFTKYLNNRSVARDRTSCMGVSNLRTGLFERLCEHNNVADVINAALASAAIPGTATIALTVAFRSRRH
jgi:predicted acylesterase/phospholipase RssA